jgi:hypothetical protein
VTESVINPSHQSLCLYVYSPLLLLENGLVNTFIRQRRIVGGRVFYAVRVVSKESMRLVFPRTSCCILFYFQITRVDKKQRRLQKGDSGVHCVPIESVGINDTKAQSATHVK